jgi:hypothetical protein
MYNTETYFKSFYINPTIKRLTLLLYLTLSLLKQTAISLTNYSTIFNAWPDLIDNKDLGYECYDILYVSLLDDCDFVSFDTTFVFQHFIKLDISVRILHKSKQSISLHQAKTPMSDSQIRFYTQAKSCRNLQSRPFDAGKPENEMNQARFYKG